MKLDGDREISATRELVYEALNDPDVLKDCIPGCESIERTSDTGFSAKVALKVGPVKAKFTGDVSLENLNPPASYSLVGKGKGGAAGFASGRADVTLTEQETGTLLSYTVDVEVGGKIAQLGSRLISGTANRLSGEFFDKFSAIVEARAGAPDVSEAAAPAEEAAEEASPTAAPAPEPVAPAAAANDTAPAPAGAGTAGSPPWIWWGVGGAAILVAAAIILS